ncbi:beta-lactamase family protein [Tamlana fucoidanivorans]|uniref:Beta-lactamase family protein n=1 Tax=Allotamlana fucoidanivorans TaxID=2583814 RepID=A0A5C4SL54_9FLAO|nr:serine hydrolase domain-containing protein [Tamlana fucoidanivorans]TNJ44308.1 beta-lactamase family protein [Tamlana fucoidanivorans]
MKTNFYPRFIAILAIAMLTVSCSQTENTKTEASASTEKTTSVPPNTEVFLKKYAGQKNNLTVAEHKKLLEEGYPLNRMRRAQDLFSARHFTSDVMDDKETGMDDALYYHNFMWEFLPSAVVPASENQFELPRVLDSRFDEITYDDVEGNAFPTLIEYTNSSESRLQAIMMIHKGKVVYENYPGMRPEDKHVWMSVTKAVTGTLMMDLIVSGKVDDNAPITDYVPRLKGSDWDNVPVRAVLTMSAGLNADDVSGNMYKYGTMEQRYYQASFGDLYEGKHEDWIDVIREAKKIAEPYSLYQYASMNTQVLSVAIENVTGKKMVDHLYDRLFKYAGTGEFVPNLFPDGTIHSATAMNSTLEDMGRFGLLYTPSFQRITGKEVISQEIIDYLFESMIPAEIFNKNFVGKTAYKYLGDQAVIGSGAQFDFLWEDGALAKLGHNGQGIYIDPKRDFVGVYFSSSVDLNRPVGYMRAAALSLDNK